jgi:hypothetical protein
MIDPQVKELRTWLLKELTERYRLQELYTLCMQLGVDYEDLGVNALEPVARELILFLEKRKAVDELVKVLDPDQTQAPGSGRSKLDVSVSLLTNRIPPTYYQQLSRDEFPLVRINAENRGQDEASIRVSAVIEGCSDMAVDMFSIPSGERSGTVLLPVLQPAAVGDLNEIRVATLRVKVEQVAPKEQLVYDQAKKIKLLARETALLAVRSLDGTVTDLTDYLAAWVTPHHPTVDRLLRKTVDYHPNVQIVGYLGKGNLAQIVRLQVQAVFNVLKYEAKVVYVDSHTSFGAQAGQIMQRVRLPEAILAAGGPANCIDGTVLFASLLEAASLDPVIAIVPGHAFVGWHVWKGANTYEFLETTMIGSNDFEAAFQRGQVQYQTAREAGYFEHGLFDKAGFARLIDVAACRKKDIYPV